MGCIRIGVELSDESTDYRVTIDEDPTAQGQDMGLVGSDITDDHPAPTTGKDVKYWFVPPTD